MVFEALALLRARPVHKETVGQVNHENSADHLPANSERRNASQQSKNEPQSAKEFGADNQIGYRRRQSDMGEEAHGAVNAIPTKPAQHFLRPVREEHHSQNQSQHRQSHVVASTHQSLHRFLLAGSVFTMAVPAIVVTTTF